MKKYPLIGKCLVVGIILLFIGTCIIPGIAQDIEKIFQPTSRGNWLYVGGSGPGNYTRIQDAINDSSDGDTVFVYDDSSPYYENILVSKSIFLKGENRNTTIIEGDDDVLVLQAENITISSFTIRADLYQWNRSIGIDVRGIGCTVITQNIITNNDWAIYCENTHDILITENIIQDIDRQGIWIRNCYTATISGNLISCSTTSIELEHCEDINIFKNEIQNNYIGIIDYSSSSNIQIFDNYIVNNYCGLSLGISYLKIYNNIIQKNTYAFIFHGRNSLIYNNELRDNANDFLLAGYNNKIYRNNFINDSMKIEYSLDNFILYLLLPFKKPNTVDGNYWEKHSSLLPKKIDGDIIWWVVSVPGHEQEYTIPWSICDWHPAQEPYDIPRMT